jgi:hypothetical protein
LNIIYVFPENDESASALERRFQELNKNFEEIHHRDGHDFPFAYDNHGLSYSRNGHKTIAAKFATVDAHQGDTLAEHTGPFSRHDDDAHAAITVQHILEALDQTFGSGYNFYIEGGPNSSKD